MTRFIFFILIAVSSAIPGIHHDRITLDELKIKVSGASREVAYTNKEAGYYYTETQAEHRSGWQGWHIMSVKMMDDYRVSINGLPLKKADVNMAEVYPHQLHRSYTNGVQEYFTMLDSLDALVVELQNVRGSIVTLSPLFDDSRSRDDYLITWRNKVMLIAKKRHPARTEKENYPVWIGVTSAPLITSLGMVPDSIDEAPRYGPERFDGQPWHDRITFIVVAGDSVSQTVERARDVAVHYLTRVAGRKRRMENFLNASYFRTDDGRFTRAIQWAKISMDALIMNQLRKGIFAGLPWFDNYWGRDSFISLPGATLVTGDFSDARKILESFAAWQDKDPQSPTYGRIPNLVTTNSIAYNTADGTPWFTLAAEDYVRYAGDTAFRREIFPAVKLGIEGSLVKRADDKYFLTHGDAETWMDAVGPDGPWSPRGTRANDIQALWYSQLRTGSEFARSLGDTASATRWSTVADSLRANFNKYFVEGDSEALYDHLRADGSGDVRFRPNQLFAMDIVNDPLLRWKIFQHVTERLVYPHGVASLWQDDPDFHPYHHFEPAYVQDAAYHNGIVWTWLAGRWIDAAVHYGYSDLAFHVTRSMVDQILDRGAVGTLSELMDAAPRPGESKPRLSGAFFQAWSLAEFLRVAYQSYAGIRVNAITHKLTLQPHFPASLTRLKCTIPIDADTIEARYYLQNGKGEVALFSKRGSPRTDVTIELPYDHGHDRISHLVLQPGLPVTLLIDSQKVSEKTATGVRTLEPIYSESDRSQSNTIHLARPEVRPDLRALRMPSHRMLSDEEIKTVGAGARVLYEADDPAGDDNGTGTYTYPTTPNLQPGSLDLTHFRVSSDGKNVFFVLRFRNLSNPGWHPEYGFQLTFGAIAVHKDSKAGSGKRIVGRNANYILDSSDAYEDIIYVGGGIRVEDTSGNVLCEYRPVTGDEKNPLGSIQTKTVSFAIPAEIIGVPDSTWRYTVLIGAQDDHGGAGIGEFRAVGGEAGEWIGGGKKIPGDPNVYDLLLPVHK